MALFSPDDETDDDLIDYSDICRVCRSEGTADKPLFHPCICTGSIKFIHQECLVQWLKYSEKEYCELCNHRFSFIPIYSPDMPKRLPIKDIIHGLFGSLFTALRFWFHYTLVALAWLGLVPLAVYRIYKSLFNISPSALLTLPIDLISTENVLSDLFYGCCVVTCTIFALISLIWLREQILRGGGPDWLEINDNLLGGAGGRAADAPVAAPAPVPPDDPAPVNNPVPAPAPAPAPPAVEEAGEVDPPPEAENQINNNNQGELLPNNEEAGQGWDETDDEDEDEDPIPDDPWAPVDGNEADPAAPDVWNPVEWERGEELTWERILGIDGSLLFLEHVLWFISLNALFIVLFALFPYHLGYFILSTSNSLHYAAISQFEGLAITLAGYMAVGIGLVFFLSVMSLLHFHRVVRALGICYVLVKVSLLSVFEIGVFPLVCGWWLDVCSLPILGATLEDREGSFKTAPGTSMFLHWLAGMVYLFYFASLLMLLREVLRPGVLWFNQNLNDPDFNPIQEMIHLPLVGHTRRFMASLVIFGTTALLMIWVPVLIVQRVIPGFLPYNVSISNSQESPVGELSLEFLLLQLILPALLDHGHLRLWLKVLLRSWCSVVASILDIRSYLLGDVALPPEMEQEAFIPRPDGIYRPYIKPNLFGLRILALIALTGLSILIGGLLMLTVPVITGRKLISFWVGDAKVHELNTAACGLYFGLVTLRIFTIMVSWIPRGWGAILLKVKEGFLVVLKTAIAGFLLMGVIPLLIGILFDVVIIIPLRVPWNQTPIFFLGQDWAFGVLHTKVICGFAMMGDWRLREILEELYHGGIVNINLRNIIEKLALPVITCLGLFLAIPYVGVEIAKHVLVLPLEAHYLLLRKIYPVLLVTSVVLYMVYWQVSKFRHFYEHIKNDKYLVGKRLVNYDPKKPIPLAPLIQVAPTVGPPQPNHQQPPPP